jgi:hypothetical protein
MNASPSAGDHCHGYKPENSSNRFIKARRELIVPERKNLEDCCLRQPSNIAANTAFGGSSGTTFCANTNRADPGANPVIPLLYQMQR